MTRVFTNAATTLRTAQFKTPPTCNDRPPAPSTLMSPTVDTHEVIAYTRDMRPYSFFIFSRLCRSPILRLAAVTLVILAGSNLAFSDEIHKAASGGDLEKVKALLKDNPDLVFSKDRVGKTPLYLAAVTGHKDVVKFLLASKADVNAKDISGQTPLCGVALSGHKDMVELLLASKADVNAKANNGHTPLHEAAYGGNKDVVELLLASKADVNAKANRGQTPLHEAAFGGNKAVAELLLASKADINAKDGQGKTPLYWAVVRGKKDVAELLRQHGGQE